MDMSPANKIKKPKLQTVVVLGASIKPQRYSYKAVKLLLKHKHRVIPVHPKLLHINDLAVTASLSEIKTPVDTLTLYVGAERSRPLVDDIIALKPGRVIFNPGSESKVLAKKLTAEGIPFVHDCTLVMLQSDQF
jgi:predicted CoA-binding protein